jgi:hypothetical protein
MTWTGGLIAICYLTFALTIAWMIVERRKLYRLRTKAFFLVYALFLPIRAYSMLYEPVTDINILKTIISVAILFPILICTIRLMRLGDPFLIAGIVQKLREELKEKDILETKRMSTDENYREQVDLERRLRALDKRIEDSTETLNNILRLTRDNDGT